MIAAPEWLDKESVLLIHAAAVDVSGGSHGLRDEGLLESALSRPLNVFAYENVTVFDLAATYAEAIAHNHPFIDGNKRAAFAAMGLFLEINGYALKVGKHTKIMVAIAEKKIVREEIAAYLKRHSEPITDAENQS
jgi:death-on-curing protein